VAKDKKKKDSGDLVPDFSLTHQIKQFQFLDRFSAQERGIGRTVVLDIVDRSKLSREQEEDFKRSSAILSEVSSHPNIVTLLRTAATIDNRPVLVFEGGFEPFVPAASEHPNEQREEIIAAARRLNGALKTAHAAGLLHGNVRPENIVLTKFGEPALANFILWPPSGGEQPLSEWLPDGFMPPEYLLGGVPSPASDQYGFATSLFALLFGSPIQKLLPGEAQVDFIGRLVNEVPVKPSIPELSSEMWSVFLRATEKRPEKRFPSVDAFFEALTLAMRPAKTESSSSWESASVPAAVLKVEERAEPKEERVLEAAPQPPVVVVRPPRPVIPGATAVAPPAPPTPVRSATLEVGGSAIELTREAPELPELVEPTPEPVVEPISVPPPFVPPASPKPAEIKAGRHCADGHANAFGARFCTTCGISIGSGAPSRSAEPSAPTPPRPSTAGPLAVTPPRDSALRCSCGRENGVAAITCVSCGRSLRGSEPLSSPVGSEEPKVSTEPEVLPEVVAEVPLVPPPAPSPAPSPEVSVPTPAAPTPTPAPAMPPAAPKTVACRSCGYENDAEVNFCRDCAKPLRSAGSKDDVVMIFDTTQVKD